MRKIFTSKSAFYPFLLVVLVGSLVLTCIPKFFNENRVKVRTVIDGDTIKLTDGRIVRYIGVNAPQMRTKKAGEWVDDPEPGALAAFQANKLLVEGKKIRLELVNRHKDRYGRLLAYCFVKQNGQKEELLINVELLRKGLGFLYLTPADLAYIERFAQAHFQAIRDKKGIWQEEEAIAARLGNRFIGECKLVEATVVKVTQSAQSFVLFLDSTHRRYLKISIPKTYLQNFYTAGCNPETYYKGKTIRTFGLITAYSGPEIEAFHPALIEIVD